MLISQASFLLKDENSPVTTFYIFKIDIYSGEVETVIDFWG